MSCPLDIATKLQTLGYGSLVTNPKTIQVGSMDDSPNNCISVAAFGGPPSSKSMGGVVNFEFWNIQTLVRNVDPEQAESIAYNIMKALDGQLQNETINTHSYNKCEAMGPPSPLPDDENGRARRFVEFQIWRIPE